MPSLADKLNKVYTSAPVLPYDKNSRIVIMSDCHRGQGNGADNFLPNSPIFQGALEYYYKNGFTYIELGDGDELWENRCIHTIIRTYSHIFRLMNRFYQDNRLYMIYGNHDIVKKRKNFSTSNCTNYSCDVTEPEDYFYKDLKITEGIILENKDTLQRILLIHGHQGSLLNDELWPLGRFLVRYVWKPLETLGFRAPTGSGRSVKLVEKIEKKLCAYSRETNRIVIAGHTHRPVFPNPGSCPYFNDGSCVHPYSITCLEIENDQIALVRWSFSTTEDRLLFISREVLNGPENLSDFILD